MTFKLDYVLFAFLRADIQVPADQILQEQHIANNDPVAPIAPGGVDNGQPIAQPQPPIAAATTTSIAAASTASVADNYTLSTTPSVASTLQTSKARRQSAAGAAAARIALMTGSITSSTSTPSAVSVLKQDMIVGNERLEDQNEEKKKQSFFGLPSSAGEDFRDMHLHKEAKSGKDLDIEDGMFSQLVIQETVDPCSSLSMQVNTTEVVDRPRNITSLPQFYVLVDLPSKRGLTAPTVCVYRSPSRTVSSSQPSSSANRILREVTLGTIAWVTCRIIGQDQNGAHWLKIPDGWVLEEGVTISDDLRRGMQVKAKYWVPLVNGMSNHRLVALERGLGALNALSSSSSAYEKNQTNQSCGIRSEDVKKQMEELNLSAEQRVLKDQLHFPTSSPIALQEVSALQEQLATMTTNMMKMQSMMLSCQITLSKLINGQ